jgi:predicted DNA-binding transcriptional regulator AlpA
MRPSDLSKATQRHHIDARAAIEAWVRERGLRGLENERSAAVRVMSLDEVAQRADTTRRNIERLNAAGQGPRLVQVWARKIGVIESDFEEWLKSRRRPALGKADEPGGPPSAGGGAQ